MSNPKLPKKCTSGLDIELLEYDTIELSVYLSCLKELISYSYLLGHLLRIVGIIIIKYLRSCTIVDEISWDVRSGEGLHDNYTFTM